MICPVLHALISADAGAAAPRRAAATRGTRNQRIFMRSRILTPLFGSELEISFWAITVDVDGMNLAKIQRPLPATVRVAGDGLGDQALPVRLPDDTPAEHRADGPPLVVLGGL